MKKNFLLTLYTIATSCVITGTFIYSCDSSNKNEKMKTEFKEFIKDFETRYIPLYKEMYLTSWNADISGEDMDYKKAADAEFKCSKIFSSKADFEKLKKIKESGAIKDSIEKRELELLYNFFIGAQYDTALMKKAVDLQSEISSKFNTFRAVVGKDSLNDNKVDEILKKSTDSKKLEATWMASKKSGKLVAEDIIKLVKLRNEIAKQLGFSNYHQMQLKLNEQDPADIEKIYDELDSLTRKGFISLKDEIDEYLARHYKIKKEQLMPWHYQNRFFQEAPAIYDIELDKYYKGKDLVKITENYYKSIGLDVSDLFAKSDLYGKPKKYQHAQCSDLDNEGDVRVMCSVIDNEYWMGTLLHEFGHAGYDKYIDNKSLPFILRDPAHIFTTEAIAELFGRFSSKSDWIKDVLGLTDKEVAEIGEKPDKRLRLQMLVFSRWSQVMYRFEKALYENPEQDLNKLWWDLVEKYQMMKRPKDRNEPDWASKIHIATSPCYYHNYLLGEILASQLYYYITKNILKSDDYKNQSFANRKEVGQYLIEKVYKPGKKYYWNDMIEKATGEKLTAKYYAKQFVDSIN